MATATKEKTDIVLEIPLGNLVFDEITDRTQDELKSVEALTENMKAQGQITPIVVKPIEGSGGKYLVIAGKRRTEAAKRLKLPSLRATIFLGDETSQLAMVSDNIMHRATNPVMQAKVFDRLLNDGVYKNQTDLAKAMGVTQGTVSKLMGLLKTDPETQQAVANKVLPAYVAQKTKDKVVKTKDGKKTVEKVKKTVKELKEEIATRKWNKLPGDVLLPKSGEKDPDAFNIWVSKEKIKVTFVLPIKAASDSIEKAIKDEIGKVGDGEVTASIKRFRKTID